MSIRRLGDMAMRNYEHARRKKGDVKRDALVEAAVNLLLEKGLDNFSLKEVADKAEGVDLGNIYYFYKTKGLLTKDALALLSDEPEFKAAKEHMQRFEDINMLRLVLDVQISDNDKERKLLETISNMRRIT